MLHKLKAREYKLLLKPDRFSESALEKVERFWNDRMKRLIDDELGQDDQGSSRHEGRFSPTEVRVVRYWDTADCLLTRAHLTLRERRQIDKLAKSDECQITLKLRMPDMFVVADAQLDASSADHTKFEEDIAPLEVDNPASDGQPVSISPSRSIRSRFSLSTTKDRQWSEGIANLGNAQQMFSKLADHLPFGTNFDPQRALIAGPSIREEVFENARVRLGANVTGKFALTLWFFDRPAPHVAEISFKSKTANGEMPGKAARRGLKLFIGMQNQLSDWINADYSSKTALALPGNCGNWSE
ncbi:hypothetical protein IE4803_PD00095 (plasmid) [Rhizobium etli bv. phaseoli str. IE4803]|nr:hypothetical protein IE4803_PD00095 [Rhizobium etli bv. phaseoli str. IE4803]